MTATTRYRSLTHFYFLIAVMRLHIRSMLPTLLGDDLPEAYIRFIERTYREALAEYEEAGKPFGDEEAALALWVEFDRIARPN